MKEEKPQVVIRYEPPSNNFEEEFKLLEFIEEVLGWAEEDKQQEEKNEKKKI